MAALQYVVINAFLARLPPRMQDGTITKKNSPARNVHRLLNTLNFIAAIFENLAKGMPLKVGSGGASALAAACMHRSCLPAPAGMLAEALT